MLAKSEWSETMGRTWANLTFPPLNVALNDPEWINAMKKGHTSLQKELTELKAATKSSPTYADIAAKSMDVGRRKPTQPAKPTKPTEPKKTKLATTETQPTQGATKGPSPTRPTKVFLSTAEKVIANIQKFDSSKPAGAAKTFLNLPKTTTTTPGDVEMREPISFKIFYIQTNLKEEALRNTQPLHTLRLALKDLGAPYVQEISFMDKSKR